MQDGRAPILYIRLRKQVRLPPGRPVLLGHVAQVIVDPEYEQAVRTIELMRPGAGEQFVLVDMLAIVNAVRQRYPDMEIECYGEPHALIELAGTARVRQRRALLPIVLILLFIGSGLTIMNFHADVSMLEVHRKLYKLITGVDNPHPLILQVPYSLGLGAGMMIFFNRVFKKKLNEEPDPLEVEMYLYQENVRHYLVTEEYSRMNDSEGGRGR